MEFLWFIAGIAVGVIILLLFALHLYVKTSSKKTLNNLTSASIKKLAKDPALLESVKARMDTIISIAEKQETLMVSATTPSASASHSKYKNTIIRELKALEQEKMRLFKSIISDGVDLKMKTSVDGKEQIMYMSELLKKYEDETAPASSPKQPAQKPVKTDTIIPKKNNPLKLVANNKGNNNEPGNPKIH